MSAQGGLSVERAVKAMELVSQAKARRTELLKNEDVRALIEKARRESAQDNSAYMIYALLLGIETYSKGDKMYAGQVFNDALMHFLSEYKAAFGEETTTETVSALIHNMALLLPETLRARVNQAIGMTGGKR
jgi:hypothetical protein